MGADGYINQIKALSREDFKSRVANKIRRNPDVEDFMSLAPVTDAQLARFVNLFRSMGLSIDDNFSRDDLSDVMQIIHQRILKNA